MFPATDSNLCARALGEQVLPLYALGATSRCWLHHRGLNDTYKVAGSQVDYEAALGRSSVPALFINFPGDNYAPAACASYLASKLRSAHVTVRSLSAAQLGITRSDHFRWAAQPQNLVRDTVKWIRTHAR